NELIGRWMPAFTSVAERLGMGGMASILRDTTAKARPEPGQHSMRPHRPLNYTVQLGREVMRPLIARDILGSDSSGLCGDSSKSGDATKAGFWESLRRRP